MVVAILFARSRTGRGGLGWWTGVWVSFMGLLSFGLPNRANSLGGFPHHMGHLSTLSLIIPDADVEHPGTIIAMALNKICIADVFFILSMVHYRYHRKEYRLCSII